MFERFKRSSKTQQYDGSDYGRGTGFQGGDGYATQTDGRAADDYGDRTATGSGNAERTTTDTGNSYATDARANEAGTPAGAAVDRSDTRSAVADRPARAGAAPAAATTGAAAPATAREARAIQRERWGGSDATAIFFGWLSALGLAALLLAIVAAAGTSLGFANNVTQQDATSNAGTIGIVGAAILVVILLLAYYAGGYVSGRMARFDGARQGFRVWLLGLLVTIAAAVAGWIGGEKYNVFHQLNLPRIPVKEGDITTGAIITLAVVLVGTLLAAVVGGKAGDRYHARVDATAWDNRA